MIGVLDNLNRKEVTCKDLYRECDEMSSKTRLSATSIQSQMKITISQDVRYLQRNGGVMEVCIMMEVLAKT